MVSGQRGYFYEQKVFFKQEIDRLNTMYKKNYYKKRMWKQKFIAMQNEIFETKGKLEKELSGYRERVKIFSSDCINRIFWT